VTTTLSDPTLGLLIEVGAANFGGSDLKTMLLRSDLWKYAHDTPNRQVSKQDLVRSRLLGAQEAARHWDPHAGFPTGREAAPEVLRAQLAFARELLDKSRQDPECRPAAWLGELREALLADGYQLAWDRRVERIPSRAFGPDRENVVVTYRFLPTDASAAPLGPEISALEADLMRRGYTVVLNHYQQASRNLLQHNYEATNGQLRAALEGLVVAVAKDHAGYVGQGKAGEGRQAIQHLVSTNHLPENEGGRMLIGVWETTHTRGPHPGQSTADEARIRMQLVTATARFLLNHFPV
jgi:hypothetical protein